MADFLQLDGKTYTISPLLVEIGLPTFVRVSKMMGPGFVRLIADPELRKKDAAGPEMSTLVADLFTRLDDPQLMSTVATLMDTVQENGVPLAQRWRMEFSGRLLTLCKILLFTIQAHFGDFLKGFGSPESSSSKPEPKEAVTKAGAKKANANG